MTVKNCKLCTKEFNCGFINETQYISKNKEFCSHSCAAKFNNSKRIKIEKLFKCQNCSNEFPYDGSPYNKFCSIKCSGDFRAMQSLKKSKDLFDLGLLKFRRIIYKILTERDGNKCSVCGITEWQNKFIRLWVDHIDGDPSNNKPENFRLICPNCESQTDTSRGKNYGKGRKSKGLPCYG